MAKKSLFLESVVVQRTISQYIQSITAVLIGLLGLTSSTHIPPDVKEFLRLKLKSVIRNREELDNPVKFLSLLNSLKLSMKEMGRVQEALEEAEEPKITPESQGGVTGGDTSALKKFLRNLAGEKGEKAYDSIGKFVKEKVLHPKTIVALIIAAFAAWMGHKVYVNYKNNKFVNTILHGEVVPVVEHIIDLIVDGKITKEHQIISVMRRLEDSLLDKYGLMGETGLKSDSMTQRWNY